MIQTGINDHGQYFFSPEPDENWALYLYNRHIQPIIVFRDIISVYPETVRQATPEELEYINLHTTFLQ